MPSLFLLSRRVLAIALLLVGAGGLLVRPTSAQTTAPVVRFIVDNAIGSASPVDASRTGLSKFAERFRALGATVEFIALDRPIPDDTDVVVLARPTQTVTVPHAARLWAYLQNGGNLLLAVDPENFYVGYANVSPQILRSGLVSLLTLDYGLLIREGFIIEPGYTQETIVNQNFTYASTYAEIVSHPVTAPLRAYSLPVWVWGARPLVVEPFGVDSEATPLLYSNAGFAETNPNIFRRLRGTRFSPPTAPLEINIGVDLLGRMNVAGLAENTASGSRVAVLGDSELLMNGFGLNGTATNPRYPGNAIFADRLAAWLLELPEQQWPALPQGYTWMAIDGNPDEWPETAAVISDAPDLLVDPTHDILSIRALQDDRYVYFYVETGAPPPENTRVDLRSDTVGDGSASMILSAYGDGRLVLHGDTGETPLADGAVAVGRGIEFLIPRRVMPAQVADLCIYDPAIMDCAGQPIAPAQTGTRAPADLRVGEGLIVVVESSINVNLRQGPSTATQVLATIPDGTAFAALGRNSDASWIRVENATHSGWLHESLILANGDTMTLPEINEAP